MPDEDSALNGKRNDKLKIMKDKPEMNHSNSEANPAVRAVPSPLSPLRDTKENNDVKSVSNRIRDPHQSTRALGEGMKRFSVCSEDSGGSVLTAPTSNHNQKTTLLAEETSLSSELSEDEHRIQNETDKPETARSFAEALFAGDDFGDEPRSSTELSSRLVSKTPSERVDKKKGDQPTLTTAGSSGGRNDSEESLPNMQRASSGRSILAAKADREEDKHEIGLDDELDTEESFHADSYWEQELSRSVATTFVDEPSRRRGSMMHGGASTQLDARLKGHGKSFRRMMKNKTTNWVITKFPRTLAILVGIIIPLWLLNLFSLVFGVWLASQEAPGEINNNDEELARDAQANVKSLTVTNITTVAPRLCAELYMTDEDISSLDMGARVAEYMGKSTNDVMQDMSNIFGGSEAQMQADSMNWTHWYLYMADCGEAIRSYAESLLALTSAADRASAGVELTFNWIRCHEDANGRFDAFLSDKLPIGELDLDSQAATYKRFWEEDRERLFEEYYSENIAAGMNPSEAVALANSQSLSEATGGDGCTLNGPGAAFFWFTVMTTIGYGNQAPDSTGGRTLLYTLGFVSILAFGSILATAGTISSVIFDDFAANHNLRILTRPWCACLVWGGCYYGWMALIAWAAHTWKQNRVDGSFSFRDGYWFAYLSTTTVGLGDVYLESAVILGSDLLYLPIMMLFGFVFLAAFLGKFRDLAMTVMKQKRATFIESLLLQMNTGDKEDDGIRTRMAGRMFVTNDSRHRQKMDEDDT